MDKQGKQRRVSFSDVRREIYGEPITNRDISKTGSFRAYDDEIKTNTTRTRDYNGKESEFGATIAAAAYAIYSLEETRAESERKMVDSFRESFRESFRAPPTENKSIHDHDHAFLLPDLGRSTRRSSQVERRDSREGPTMISSTRPIEVRGSEQRGDRHMESKAAAWERARMEKINKWYEKMNRKILEWESEKKKKAGLDMEKRKAELERLKRINLHHYSNKIEWIEGVSGGARKQLEEKKISEEAQAKRKAKKITSTGKVPAQCFCFEC